MKTMNRRELLQRATCMVVATAASWEECNGAPRYIGALTQAQQAAALQPSRQRAKAERTPLPANVAGVRLPDTKLAQGAVELAASAYPPYLLNHALRTYVFGALVGRAHKHAFDEETLYIACLLHDLGLTAQFEGDMPFEIQGAEAARKFLAGQGVARDKAEMIWDGIAMHASAIGGFKQPEISLVGEGAGADVLGPDPAEVPADKLAETLSAFPRLKFKEQFLKSCADVISRHPGGATRSFMRDIGERYVPSFHPRNFCDLVEKAPFEE
jgi:HD domain-containing protein